MFNRPRCRDWTALSTQQLRLRSLIKITGHNIICDSKYLLYFTLHSSSMSAPFYTSDKVDSHGTGNVEWAEINCPEIMKSAAKCMCIRVWEHKNIDSINSKKATEEKNVSEYSTPDKILFVWGVYFSGLVQITKRTDVKFLPNSLAFQMHGGYFASPQSLTSETTRQQLTLNYELEQDYTKACYSASSRSADSEKFIKEFKSNDAIKITTADKNLGTEFEINSPRSSRGNSPDRENSVKKKSSDLNKDMLQMLKTRYIAKQFLKSEIRSSYNLEKLLTLQEKQRKYKQKSEHANEISEKICMKSAFCLNLDLITSKGFYYQQRGNPSMGRTLNRLLFQEQQIKPEDILKGQEYKRQIELARFRCQLLAKEKDRLTCDVRNLEKKTDELHDNIIEQESCLMSYYRNLSREIELLNQEKQKMTEQHEILFRNQKKLRQMRAVLCKELQNIYPISKNDNGQFSINNVILPNTDYLISDIKLTNSDNIRELISPLSLSVALGYVAHIVHMCSVIYNVPLR